MNKKNRYFFSLLALILFITPMTQCSKDTESNKVLKKSKDALIISFELGTYKGKLNGTSLLIELPYGTDISSLSAKVKLSLKATIKPDPTKVKDWSNPVSFTVTAENGESKKYTVTVKILRPVLTFEKLTKEYTKGGHLNATEILKHVKGEKASYTLKDITNLNPNDIVKVNGTAPNLRLEFNRVGVFTALLRLKHNATSDLDVTISNAEFEITKRAAPSLTWTKQTKPFSSDGEITNTELLAGVTGSGKTGYTIKTVTISSAGGTGARVSGSGTAAKIVGYTQTGTLTLTLVFEHDTKADKTLSNAKFEITKASAMRLSWTKQTKPFSSGGEITNANLLAGVTGSGKTGYTIKTVTISNDGGMISARVSGSGRAAKIINYNKAGTLTLTLVLTHPTKEDVTLRNAQFEITKTSAPSLNWIKQRKVFSSGGEITNTNLLTGVTGSGKTGYTIKTVTISNNGGITSATVSGSGTAAKITSYNKAGTLTLTLVLEHDTKEDVTLSNAKFEITKTSAPSLGWNNQRKAFSSGGEITNMELLAGVTGSGKNGYTIKTVTISNNGGMTRARVSVSGRAARITGYTKAGTLTLTLVLEHTIKTDVTIRGAEFEITKTNAPRLTWTKQAKAYSRSREITNANLLTGVTGSGKTGYTIKTVNITNDGGMTSARVSWSGRAARITSYTKAGTLTLTLVLEHPYKQDATIRGAEFEITKTSAPRLTWTKQTKAYSRNGEITNANLLAGVTGRGKTGYTIKTVNITNTNGTGARVSGSGTSAKITSYNKIGTLTLTLVLEHDTKEDVTISNAQFHIYSDIFTITSGGEITLKASVDRLRLTTVTIPYMISGTTVTSIGNETFKDCVWLTDITIPNSVTSIGTLAFRDCRELTSITLPNSVTSIGREAFRGCSKITSITLPNSVTSIGREAFHNCTGLTSITIPNSVTSIGEEAFVICKALTSITIPNSVTSIERGTFMFCLSLTSVTIPNSVTNIGDAVFYGCRTLTSITIPNSVTSIGTQIFSDCGKLTTIRVPTDKVSGWSDRLKYNNPARVVGY